MEIINLKSDGVLDLLISGTPGILPAYHMDKRHWVSILLDGGITPEELFALIDASHALTGGPRRHRDAPCQMTSTGPGGPLPFPPLISTFDPLHGTCGRCSILHSTHSVSLST